MHEPPLILVVEDEPTIREILAFQLEHLGYGVLQAKDGEEAVSHLEHEQPDLVITDVDMPNMDGFQLCEYIKQDPTMRLIPTVIVTALDSPEDYIKGVELGADDFITKPFHDFKFQARVRSLLKLKQFTDELESAEEIIFSLALTVEAKDSYTRGHSYRIAKLGVEVAERLGLDDDELLAIRRGGILHDIGKIGMPDSILFKDGSLTPDELAKVREHPEKGESICKPLKSLETALPIIRHHHERMDGKGYPDGLVGEDIPLGARIVCAVDMFDALNTQRPYKAPLPKAKTCRILQDAAVDGQLDPAVVKHLIEAVNELDLWYLG